MCVLLKLPVHILMQFMSVQYTYGRYNIVIFFPASSYLAL